MRRVGRGGGVGGREASQTGRCGEAMAARFLEAAEWRVLAERWRDGPRELDLVATRAGVLAFVEVKTRRSAELDPLLLSVTPSKRRELERAAAAWLRRFGATFPPFLSVRFDVIGVLIPWGEPPRLVHIESAWTRT